MKLGLLEFGSGCDSPMDIVDKVLTYAQQAEVLGYTRIWLGEHYGSLLAYHNPEVLLPIIAGLTSHIRVGVAGLLMTFHNPYRVASAFKLLANLFPDRIDLGVVGGRVPPEIGNQLVPDYDRLDSAARTALFTNNRTDLYHYLFSPEQAAQLVPHNGLLPAFWSLSANMNNVSALSSADASLCRSLFHSPIDDHKREAEKLQQYRAEFFNNHGREPEINLAVAGVCAETTEKARHIRAELKKPFSLSNELVGSPTYLLDELSVLQEIYGVDEFIFMNMAEEIDHKFNGIELLANRLSDYSSSSGVLPPFRLKESNKAMSSTI